MVKQPDRSSTLEASDIKAPQTLRADIKTLHKQLEELSVRGKRGTASEERSAKSAGEPPAFSAGK